MTARAFCSVLTALTVAGCVITPAPEGTSEPQPKPDEAGAGRCDAGPVQPYLGMKATEETGAAILAKSGARGLRWGAPRSVWTMDYRQDRVNVRYDDDMIITDITCG